MSAKGIKAGRAYVELGVDDRIAAGLKRAERRLKAFGSGFASVGTQATALGAAIVAPLAASVKVFANAGDQLDKMSKRTGFTVEALSELGFAAEQSGSDLGTLEKGIKTMQRSIADAGRGLSTQVDALEGLGLAYADLKDLSPEDQFSLIADRIAGIEDPTQKAALSMQLLGRAGQSLIPLLSGGAEGMDALRAQARELGLTISGETATEAAEFTDAMNILRRVVKQGVILIGSALTPSLKAAAGFFKAITLNANRFIDSNKSVIATVFKVAAGVLALGGAFLTLGLVATLAATAVGGIATVFTAVVAVAGLVASPIAIAGAAIAGFVALVATRTTVGARSIEFLGNAFRRLASVVGPVFEAMRDAIAGGDLSLAVEIAGANIQLAWLSMVKVLKTAWGDFLSFVASTSAQLPNALNASLAVIQGGISGVLGTKPTAFQIPIPGSADAILNGFAQGIKASTAAEERGLEQSINRLREQILKLNNEAAKIAGEAGGGLNLGGRLGDLFDSITAAASGESIATAGGVSVRGTFNANALEGFGGSGQAKQLDRTATATEKTATNTSKIIKKLEGIPGAARFA